MYSRNRNRSEALARGTQALVNGELNDPALEKLLGDLEDYVALEGAGGDYYYLSRDPSANGRRLKDPDKVFLVAEPRQHGMEQHPLTHRAISATQQMHERGGPLVNAPSKDLAIAQMRDLLAKYVMPTSIGGIGSGGQRSQRNAEQLLDVASSLMVDTDRGYNSRAGYALAGMPLDAGHIIGHASRPDLSDKGYNLEWENQYANKGKAATEKMAANQGREATDAELAAGLFKSHKNKLTADVVLPGRKGSKEREAYMEPIRKKVDSYYQSQGLETMASPEQQAAQRYKDGYAGSVKDILNEEGAGDQRSKSIVINADTVNLGDAKINGNGRPH